MPRLPQLTLILSTLLASWLAMQWVHESGHVLGAWLSGGTVTQVVLHPLTISRTDVEPNPAPLVVVWAGPIFGVLVPLALWLVVTFLRMPCVFLFRFFAGFCLIANGAYISIGSWEGIGDCGEMLHHGSPVWLLWLFGLLTVLAGLALWHKQGKHFGVGAVAERVEWRTAIAVTLLWIALASVGALLPTQLPFTP